MRNLTFISIAFLFATLVSCKKESMVVIQAQDYNNPTDGSKYAGMHYQIIERRSVGFDTKSNIVADDYLDNNGRAAVEINMKGNRSYVLGIQKPDNICYTEITIEHFIDYQQNNTVNFNYLACGYVNLPRVNINCEGPDDKFRVKYYYSNNTDIYIYTGFLDENYDWQIDKFIEGCIDYSNVNVYYERPVGDYTLEWQVERQSGTTTGIYNFTISENDTTNYLIEY